MQNIRAAPTDSKEIEAAALTRLEAGVPAWYVPLEVWQRKAQSALRVIAIPADVSQRIEAAIDTTRPCADANCERLRSAALTWLQERGVETISDCPSCDLGQLTQFLTTQI
jgi:hypothetical protein